LVGFDVSQQQINLIRRFNSNVQTPDSAITLRLAIFDVSRRRHSSPVLPKVMFQNVGALG
jgi:hypothetical protein